MTPPIIDRKAIRRSFGRVREMADIPDLRDIQRHSYEDFLQSDTPREKRKDVGLQGVFRSVFPISDAVGQLQLKFLEYELEPPKHDELECLKGGLTYSSSLKARLRLVIWEESDGKAPRKMKFTKDQPVYMGTVPLMTSDGSFIINGTRRVIVSQVHRSPGVFYDHDRGKTHMAGKYLYAARIIPYRGSWLDFEFDGKDLMYLRIDRKRKILVSTFLTALPKGEFKKTEGKLNKPHEGYDRSELLAQFYQSIKWKRHKKAGKPFGWATPFVPAHHLGTRPKDDIFDKNGEVLFVKGREVTADVLDNVEAKKPASVVITDEAMANHYLGEVPAGIKNASTDIKGKQADKGATAKGTKAASKTSKADASETTLAMGKLIGEKALPLLEALEEVSTLLVGGENNIGSYLLDTFMADKNETREEALYEIYKVVRAGETPSPAAAEDLLHGLFFDKERYDLSAVGRVKLNQRLGIDCPVEVGVLRKEDIFAVVKTFMEVKDGIGDQEIDDIDNLGNRRVRSVGEVMETQYRIGLTRMARAMKERIGIQDTQKVTPNELVNAKAITSMVREFFGSSRLSQFMDQTNPLSEITHKRRLSALGPGGLTRERAGFDVRDVHPSHYGRICPIETPEGPNIGLINSLAIYTRVNQYGFIETPYIKVKGGKLTKEIEYLSAAEERTLNIARTGAAISPEGNFTEELVNCHKAGEPVVCTPEEVNYADVSPRQLVSVATALIPFLENDDANRALMGSNMQRQAVPLLFPQAPLVGTGMEGLVARDSGSALFAESDGVVDQVDATRIVVRHDEKGQDSVSAVKIYHLTKFQRSNQDTCVTQRPVVKRGDRVKQGQIIADGSSTEGGELALGRNLTVAFMVWKGYNFEDSIIISDKVVRDDVFTSLHIQEFEVTARDTKLGPEEITRDIPNAQEEQLRHLDEVGIVRVGAEVEAGDILVGKITPKGESLMTPEEKLLCAIFGERASDVKDISLTVPPGISGTVIEVRVFSRKGIQKDDRSELLDDEEVATLEQDLAARRKIYEDSYAKQFRQALLGEVSTSTLHKNKKLTAEMLDKTDPKDYRKLNVQDPEKLKKLRHLRNEMDSQIQEIEKSFALKIAQVRENDELPPGVLKMVKVFVAVKRKLQVGDKMAGRHGNKGVVSKIVPMEDMPYTEDGNPVDIILNPLGVPSRMNVGQILETHLGWAAKGLGEQINELIDAERLTQKASVLSQLRGLLGKVYKQGFYGKPIEKLTDGQVRNIAENLKNGILMATPVFEGASLKEIEEMLELANRSTQTTLYDGSTGTAFARKVTVGTIYILKLHHLVDDKIHARSTGPYSLVTQQPLGGKAQFGGQRFGEMEVWSLEAYGAAYVLQEMLTIKSDDIVGRSRAYEAIIRGDNNFESGIPESFNVLMVEMRALGLNARLMETLPEPEGEAAKPLPKPEEDKQGENATGGAETKQDEKAEAKADGKSTVAEAKPEDKATGGAEEKAGAKADGKSTVAEAKSEDKATGGAETKQEEKAEVKADGKSTVAEAKSEDKATGGAETKQDEKAEVKAAEKPASKTATAEGKTGDKVAGAKEEEKAT